MTRQELLLGSLWSICVGLVVMIAFLGHADHWTHPSWVEIVYTTGMLIVGLVLMRKGCYELSKLF